MQGAEMQNCTHLKASAPVCCRCSVCVSPDETAITRKLINRGTQDYFCVACLAEHFEVSPEEITERIRYFRSVGCTLFDRK